jgi:hypothetical protein
MADAGASREAGRLPWLEPYRAPVKKKSNRSAGGAASIGAAGLAVALAMLMRDAPMFSANEPAAPPQASIALPAPADMQQPIVLAPLAAAEPVKPSMARPAAPFHRAKARVQRRIKAVPTSAAYRSVIDEQAGDPVELDAETVDAAVAIAALPLPPDPPRPAVNPAAQVVRGKTIQLGVYQTAEQAELAWRSAVRDYTYLVTMPKSIEPISIRSKRFYRLQLGTPSRQHAKQLCTNLKSIGRTCRVA